MSININRKYNNKLQQKTFTENLLKINRSIHIVRDFTNQKIRILTPKETERIQGFPDDCTKIGMPEKFR